MTDEKNEAIRKFMQYCNECPKASDFTCSGADAAKCLKEREEELRKVINNQKG